MRPRRGSHFCGPHICAGTAALLLLLSVAVLHSRLSSSRVGLGFQPQTLSSSDDLSIPFTEEFDPIDDTANYDSPEIDDSPDKFSKSGLFWDHVTGVLRRAFNNRRSPPSLLAQHLNFDPDPDRGVDIVAFTSDDLPLDEYLGRKLGDVETVEDALLLKKSKLRAGWASWFDKKWDFLKKDRMLRSNMEILNPLNNPLLQDPDMPGVTELTRGDKLYKKMILRQLDSTPFGSSNSISFTNADGLKKSASNDGSDQPFDSLKNAHSRVENVRVHSDSESKFRARINIGVKEGNSATLKPIDQSKTEKLTAETVRTRLERKMTKNLRSESDMSRLPGRRNIELKRGIYADGKRWGYFPGLRSHLSFSEFMDEFLERGNCSIRVFMVWNSPGWMFGVRHQRSLESVLYHHRDACVAVFSETVELDYFNDFVKDGFKVAVVMPNLDELLKDTPTHAFVSVWHEWRKTEHYPLHYSELIRLAALYKYGGVYLDFDVIVLKPLYSLKNSIAKEDELSDSSTFNGAAMAFERNSPFIMECLHEFYTTYDDTRRRWNGADLLTRVVERIVSRDDTSLVRLDLKMRPFAFFPISSRNIIGYFSDEADEARRAHRDLLFGKIVNESFTFHFWNSLTSALVPEPNSLVERLLNCYCLRCLEVL